MVRYADTLCARLLVNRPPLPDTLFSTRVALAAALPMLAPAGGRRGNMLEGQGVAGDRRAHVRDPNTAQAPGTVALSVAGVNESLPRFSAGLSQTPVKFGVYVPSSATGGQSVIGKRGSSAGSVFRDRRRRPIPSAGSTVTVPLALTAPVGCTGSGGSGDRWSTGRGLRNRRLLRDRRPSGTGGSRGPAVAGEGRRFGDGRWRGGAAYSKRAACLGPAAEAGDRGTAGKPETAAARQPPGRPRRHRGNGRREREPAAGEPSRRRR